MSTQNASVSSLLGTLIGAARAEHSDRRQHQLDLAKINGTSTQVVEQQSSVQAASQFPALDNKMLLGGLVLVGSVALAFAMKGK